MNRHVRIPELLRKRPVEIFAGLLMIGTGLSFSHSPGWPGTAGSILAAVGGVLLSWITAVYYTREQAVEEHEARTAAQMQTMSHQLGVASAQIREAVLQTTVGESSAQTCFALILQAHSSLSGLLNQMQATSGDVAFDPDTIINTAEQVKSLGTRLSALASEQAAIPGTRQADQELAALRSELDEVLSRLPAEGKAVGAAVRCPECGSRVTFDIGLAHGDSASPTCPECNYRFHAHRGSDGGVFTRRPGQPELTTVNSTAPTPGLDNGRTIIRPTFTVNCPDCEHEIKADVGSAPGSSALLECASCKARFNVHRVAAGDLLVRSPAKSFTFKCPECEVDQRVDIWNRESKKKPWLCLNCLAKLTLDTELDEVITCEKEEPLIAQEVSAQELYCPDCHQGGKRFGSYEGRSLAWCPNCHNLLIEPSGEDGVTVNAQAK